MHDTEKEIRPKLPLPYSRLRGPVEKLRGGVPLLIIVYDLSWAAFVFHAPAFVPHPQVTKPISGYWLAAIVVAIPVAWYVASVLKHRRLRQRLATRHCVRCGYDLRATPERCPECGMPAEKLNA